MTPFTSDSMTMHARNRGCLLPTQAKPLRTRALKVITISVYVVLVLPSVSAAQGGRVDDVRYALGVPLLWLAAMLAPGIVTL